MPVILSQTSRGDVGQVGHIDVDVETGQLLVTPDLVSEIEIRAAAIVERSSSPTASRRRLPGRLRSHTGELPYWAYTTDHAIVVVGYDEGHVYVNDPDRTEAPIAVPIGDFELAWLERDFAFALIKPIQS